MRVFRAFGAMVNDASSKPLASASVAVLKSLDSLVACEQQSVKAFMRQLLERLESHGCARAMEFLTPELCSYLASECARSPTVRPALQSVVENFLSFLRAVGPKLRPLVAEFDKARSSGKGVEGFIELLALLADHASAELRAQDYGYDEVEFLTSSMADREPPVGLVVSLPGRHPSCWRVDFSQECRGAFVYILRPVGEVQGPALVVCRGTAVRATASGAAMTVYNDITDQIGMAGIQGIWPSIKTYFTENSASSVEMMGKSLGGGLAQGLATLLQGTQVARVQRLIISHPTGVCDQVHDACAQLIEPLRFKVTRFRLARLAGLPDDLVPKMGGYPLGKGRTGGLLPFEDFDVGEGDSVMPAQTQKRPFRSIWHLLRAIGKTHTRQMRWVRDKRVVKRPLKSLSRPRETFTGASRLLERLRLLLARPIVACLKKLAPSKFDYKPFKEFYEREVASHALSLLSAAQTLQQPS